MNKMMMQTNPMMPSDRKGTSRLNMGDRFTLNGEVGTFLAWDSMRFSRFGNIYRFAKVRNGDGETVRWALNMAGSVKVLG